MTVRQVADKLASFVAKNGRQFEDITRQRNPGDSPFKYDCFCFADIHWCWKLKKSMITWCDNELLITCLVICRFLFDKNCSDYKYYETRLAEEEKVLAQTKDAQASKIGMCIRQHHYFWYYLSCVLVVMPYVLLNAANSSTVSSRAHSDSQRSSFEHKSNYQTPASALYGAYEGSSSQGGSSNHGKSLVVSFWIMPVKFFF